MSELQFKQQIVIIDTGCANISSVKFAIERLGVSVTVSDVPSIIQAADKVLLPGVGAASAAMTSIKQKELVETIQQLKQPVLGICLGMQMAVIEFARNVLGMENANSTEMDETTSYPVISLMEEQKSVTDMGGTMRLGAWDCHLTEGSLVHKVYGATDIAERHRHRFEFNNDYKDQMTEAGLEATGFNPKTGLVEVIEIPSHPWFIGVQYHPEYRSTVASPHPLFVGFVKAVLAQKQQQKNASLA